MISPVGLTVAYLCLFAATPFVIVPWLTFIVVGLVTYAGFLKLAARLLRYSVSWKSGFHFAGITLIIVIFGHMLTHSEPSALRIGNNVVLLLGLVVLGGWSSASAVQIAAVQFLGGAAACDLWHWRLQLGLLWRARSFSQFRFFSATTFPRRHSQLMKNNPASCITFSTRPTLLI